MNASPLQDWTQPGSFGYPIWLANSFAEVLDRSNAAADPLEISELAEVVRRCACTLLQARGGGGKTYTAQRICDVLEERGLWTAIVPAVSVGRSEQLGSWTPAQWAENVGDADSASRAEGGQPGLLVIDGLNEVDRTTGEWILESIGAVTASNPFVSFLITDRLTRRSSASRFWKYATLGSVPDDVIRSVALTEPTEALAIPFYLARHSAGSAAHEILTESIGRFVDSNLIPGLATGAYRSYQARGRRTLDRKIVSSAVGADVWQKMVEAKAVIGVRTDTRDGDSSDFLFEHHLLHDFLAARHLATNPELWNPEGLDVVTLKASSFDALALALTHVQTNEAVEDLVQRVYDWNFYAAAYMLEEDRTGAQRVGDALRLALIGALAEKRFDGIVATVVRVEDALRVQQSHLTDELLVAVDRDHVVQALTNQIPALQPAWFDEWLHLFARTDGSPGSLADVESLTSNEPIVGWAAANALRRFVLEPNALAALRNLLALHGSETVRWRAAHALGPHPSGENLESLKEALRREAPSSWVAYGALRAEFEQLRKATKEVRSRLLADMADETAELLSKSGLLRTEAIRCLDVDPLPDSWHRDIEPLLIRLWETADARGAAELAALAERLRQRKEDAPSVI